MYNKCAYFNILSVTWRFEGIINVWICYCNIARMFGSLFWFCYQRRNSHRSRVQLDPPYARLTSASYLLVVVRMSAGLSEGCSPSCPTDCPWDVRRMCAWLSDGCFPESGGWYIQNTRYLIFIFSFLYLIHMFFYYSKLVDIHETYKIILYPA